MTPASVEIELTADSAAHPIQPDYGYVAHVRRDQVPGIHEMRVEGEVRDLGVVKNLRNHPYLDAHLPPGSPSAGLT